MKEKETTIFAVKAAKYSWVIPLLNLAIGAVGNSIAKTSGNPYVGLVVGVISILFLVTGLVLAIIGFLGIRENGIKQILIPSVMGFLLNSFFLFVIISVAISTFNEKISG